MHGLTSHGTAITARARFTNIDNKLLKARMDAFLGLGKAKPTWSSDF